MENIFPDKIKWDYKSKNLKSARSQCNLWKSDKDFARISLSKKLGNIAAELMRWDGARLNQDSLIWVLKPVELSIKIILIKTGTLRKNYNLLDTTLRY